MQEFSGHISARLVVPEELRWWYFHEFGSATFNEKHPTGAYPIVPITAPYLKFPNPEGKYISSEMFSHFDDGFTRRFKVMHPGVRPTHMITLVLDDIRQMAATEIVQAMVSSRYSKDAVRERLVQVVLQQAKQIIVESIEAHLEGQREDGKLHGRSAGEVFNDYAVVKDTST